MVTSAGSVSDLHSRSRTCHLGELLPRDRPLLIFPMPSSPCRVRSAPVLRLACTLLPDLQHFRPPTRPPLSTRHLAPLLDAILARRSDGEHRSDPPVRTGTARGRWPPRRDRKPRRHRHQHTHHHRSALHDLPQKRSGRAERVPHPLLRESRELKRRASSSDRGGRVTSRQPPQQDRH